MVLQYYALMFQLLLLGLFYTGVHTRCAPIKELCITLTCTNCLNWLKYLRNTSENRPYDELHCWIKNIPIKLKYYH